MLSRAIFVIKLSFLLSSIDTGVLCTKIVGFRLCEAQEPNLGSHFRKIALEPIKRPRVTPYNIDLIILKNSAVNYKQVKCAAFISILLL